MTNETTLPSVITDADITQGYIQTLVTLITGTERRITIDIPRARDQIRIAREYLSCTDPQQAEDILLDGLRAFVHGHDTKHTLSTFTRGITPTSYLHILDIAYAIIFGEVARKKAIAAAQQASRNPQTQTSPTSSGSSTTGQSPVTSPDLPSSPPTPVGSASATSPVPPKIRKPKTTKSS